MKNIQSPIDIKRSNKKIRSNNILKINYLDKNIVYQFIIKEGNVIYYPDTKNYLTFNDTKFTLDLIFLFDLFISIGLCIFFIIRNIIFLL
jgi:carbonic anhydrase